MSRHGYIDDCDDELATGRWRGQVASAIRGKRGQSFLKELGDAMDAMPVKELIAHELIDEDGQCCTIGVVCKARGLDVSKVDPEEPEEVGGLVGIAHQLAAEIEYQNDDCGDRFERSGERWVAREEPPAERWVRMRAWVCAKVNGKEIPPIPADSLTPEQLSIVNRLVAADSYSARERLRFIWAAQKGNLLNLVPWDGYKKFAEST